MIIKTEAEKSVENLNAIAHFKAQTRRRAIQILFAEHLTALCTDGTMWRLIDDKWEQIKDIPQ